MIKVQKDSGDLLKYTKFTLGILDALRKRPVTEKLKSQGNFRTAGPWR